MKSYSDIRCLDEAIRRLTSRSWRRWATQSASLFSRYIELKDEASIWNKAKSSQDQRVLTYNGKHETQFLSKSVTNFPCSPDYIHKFYSDLTNLRHMDAHIEEAKEIEARQDPMHDVRFSIVWVLRQAYASHKRRDAVLFVLKFKVGEVSYMVTQSIEHPEYPEQRGAVRSKVDSMVTEVRCIWNRRDSQVTRMVSEDPKQKIPSLYPGKLGDQTGQDLMRLRKAMSQ